MCVNNFNFVFKYSISPEIPLRLLPAKIVAFKQIKTIKYLLERAKKNCNFDLENPIYMRKIKCGGIFLIIFRPEPGDML